MINLLLYFYFYFFFFTSFSHFYGILIFIFTFSFPHFLIFISHFLRFGIVIDLDIGKRGKEEK